MKEDDFLWLQSWCQIHCNGAWECDKRIHISTLDNPGWSLTVNLRDTELEDQDFQKIEIDRTENDWLFCTVKTNQFEGACGPTNLSEILKIFHDWTGNFLDDEDTQLLDKCQNRIQIEKNELLWLQHWFYIHCNGDWEHSFGVHFEMLDTPGWSLKINLKDTALEDEIFKKVEITKAGDDWVVCTVKSNQFEGTCSPTNLYEIIKIFREWASDFLEGPDQKLLNLLENKGLHFIEHTDFAWLQSWYYIHCNGDWEHTKRIQIETLDNSGWLVTINIEDTELESREFQKIKINRSDNDWLICKVKNKKFEGKCGPTNLPDILKVFRNWTKP